MIDINVKEEFRSSRQHRVVRMDLRAPTPRNTPVEQLQPNVLPLYVVALALLAQVKPCGHRSDARRSMAKAMLNHDV